MKKNVGKCCMLVLILVLAAGIFCVFWSLKSGNLSENGTLVKIICGEIRG